MKNFTNSLAKRIKVARGIEKADLVIKNCQIVNVYSHTIEKGDIALCDGKIAGIGEYSGIQEIDAKNAYAIPGLIESHIHIESSFLTPEEFSRLLVPYGTTTAICDPHEITNVCGENGLNYMVKAASKAALDMKFMLPSCVPATPFETSGAELSSEEIYTSIYKPSVHGLAEFMNFVGVVNCDDECLSKLQYTVDAEKIIDGHAPGLMGKDRQAYISTGVLTDHECSTVEELNESIRNGMYVEMRNGSACHDLENLLSGVNEQNARRCLLCSDDRQPVTVFEIGDLNNHLKLCVEHGIDPITAVQMASLNAAECYRLYDRGALTAGKRADIVLVSDLKEFKAEKVFIEGELVAENGKYLPQVQKVSYSSVSGSVHVNNFSAERLKLNLKSDEVKTIRIEKGSIVTKKGHAKIELTNDGDLKFNPANNIAKIAVVERHHNTGNIGLGLLENYGIKRGAVAITIAHDSHNIICVGTTNEEMEIAVQELIKMGGGIVLVKDSQVLETMALPVAGLMSDNNAEWVKDKLLKINSLAVSELGVNSEIEPVSTLCFMSLPVIPELKLTDKGLFDVNKFEFTSIED
ncbi:MAG: adenine deaminase [Treponema sp.]|nr:adenine deaminase [Candidatus Treponema equifaecale]